MRGRPGSSLPPPTPAHVLVYSWRMCGFINRPYTHLRTHQSNMHTGGPVFWLSYIGKVSWFFFLIVKKEECENKGCKKWLIIVQRRVSLYRPVTWGFYRDISAICKPLLWEGHCWKMYGHCHVGLTVLTLCWGQRKSFVVISGKERSHDSIALPSTISVCLFVCKCSPVFTDCAPSPSAGSAMAGLDGLIGAEERVINSKPKISDNVVRAWSRFIGRVCASEHFRPLVNWAQHC